jgi:molecular chaperone IbpA
MNTLVTINPAFQSILDKMDQFGFGFEDQFERLSQAHDHFLSSTSYPPYNIIKNDNTYCIEIALAGFKKEDVDVVLAKNVLTISGNTPKAESDKNIAYRGIATRKFKRSFALSDNTKVKAAKMEDGMLIITIEKVVPEEEKEVSIQID